MAEGYWSSGDTTKEVAKPSPFHENNDHHDDDSHATITRAGWGDNVAPLALTMPQVSNTMDGANPNANGGNGQKAWRAGFGGSNVAPDARNLPAVDNTTGGQDPNTNSSRNPWRNSAAPAPGAIDASSPDAPARVQPSFQTAYPDAPANGSTPWGGNQGRAAYPDSSFKPQATPLAPDSSAGNHDWLNYLQSHQLTPEQQQAPPTGPSRTQDGPAPGVTSAPGLNPISDVVRTDIDNSLHLRTGVSGYLATGGLTGAAIKSAEWFGNTKLLGSAGQTHTGLLGWWQSHSPMLQQQAGYNKAVIEAKAVETTKDAIFKRAELKAADSLGNVEAMQKVALENVTKFAPESATADEVAHVLANKQNAFLADTAKVINPEELGKVLGTQEEVTAGTKLFVHNTPEAKSLLVNAGLFQEKTEAKSALDAAATVRTSTERTLNQAVENGAGSLPGQAVRGFAKGVLISGATLAAGYGLDYLGSKMFGYDQPKLDYARAGVDGIAVPLILLSNMPARYKFGLAATTFIGNHVSEMLGASPQSAQYSTLFRPNWVDSVGVTAAAMLPVDGKTKALAVGGAWLAARAYGEFAHITGIEGQDPEELRQNFESSFNHDQLTNTESSFDKTVAFGVTLGKENEVALEAEMRDWIAKQSTLPPLTNMRGTAVLAETLGKFRLEEGSRLDLASHQDTKERILKGENYDFAGEATNSLRMAAGSAVAAENFAISNKGQTIGTQVMDDNYIQQMKNEQTKIEAQLNLVYGKHDVPKVFAELTNQSRVHSDDMEQQLTKLQDFYSVLHSNDSRFVAKTARDLSLGYLAEAKYVSEKGNGSDAVKFYQIAMGYLRDSERLDSNNPDNPQIEQVQSSLPAGISNAVSDQYKSTINNPFQLKTPNFGANLMGQ